MPEDNNLPEDNDNPSDSGEDHHPSEWGGMFDDMESALGKDFVSDKVGDQEAAGQEDEFRVARTEIVDPPDLEGTLVYESQDGMIEYSGDYDNLPGKTILEGTITLEKEIGAGAQGKVFSGWDHGLGRYVAVKFLSKLDERSIEGFKREAQNMGLVKATNIVTANNFGSIRFGDGKEVPYLVLEVLDHELSDRILTRGDLTPREDPGQEEKRLKKISRRDPWGWAMSQDPNKPRGSLLQRIKGDFREIPDDADMKTRAKYLAASVWHEFVASFNWAKRKIHLPHRHLAEDMTYGIAYSVEVIRSIAHGLIPVHKKGVYHRDIKGPNIMFRPNEETNVQGEFGYPDDLTNEEKWNRRRVPYSEISEKVALTDFGLGKKHVSAGQDDKEYGGFYGTPTTASPEQAMCKTDIVDASTDVYGLGCVLYNLVTETWPIIGSTFKEMMIKKSDIENYLIVPPHEINPDVDQDLSDIIMKMIEFDQHRRHHNAEELEQDLVNWQNNYPISTKDTLRERFKKFRHRNAPAVYSGIVAVAIIAGGVYNAMSKQWAAKDKFDLVVQRYDQRDSIASITSMDALIDSLKGAKALAEQELDVHYSDSVDVMLTNLEQDKILLGRKERDHSIWELINKVESEYESHISKNPQATSDSFDSFMGELAPLLTRTDITETELRGQELLGRAKVMNQKILAKKSRRLRNERYSSMQESVLKEYRQVRSHLMKTYNVEPKPDGRGMAANTMNAIDKKPDLTRYIEQASTSLDRLDAVKGRLTQLVENAQKGSPEKDSAENLLLSTIGAIGDLRSREGYAEGLSRNRLESQVFIKLAKRHEDQGEYGHAREALAKAAVLSKKSMGDGMERLYGLELELNQARAIHAFGVAIDQNKFYLDLYLKQRRGIYDQQQVDGLLTQRRNFVNKAISNPKGELNGVALSKAPLSDVVRQSVMSSIDAMATSAHDEVKNQYSQGVVVDHEREVLEAARLNKSFKTYKLQLKNNEIKIDRFGVLMRKAMETYRTNLGGEK